MASWTLHPGAARSFVAIALLIPEDSGVDCETGP